MELSSNFPLSKFDYLSIDEREFIECFLKYQGNLKTIQDEKNMSYPATKKILVNILEKLELVQAKSEDVMELSKNKITHLDVKDCDSVVVRTIKDKLNYNNGRAVINLYSGNSCAIWFDESGTGLVSPKIPPTNKLVWEVFDAAVEVVVNNGGKAIKGKARSGARLGSDDLPLNSVEGYIAYKVYGCFTYC